MTRIASATIATIFAVFTTVAAQAAPPPVTNLTPAFHGAGLKMKSLQVYEVGGVVVIRGRAVSESQKLRATAIASDLGYTRVANLIQITEPPDDETIERLAERELSIHRGLEGCTFAVDSDGGVIRLAGTVDHDLQRDMALAVLRSIDGVQAVESNLVRR